MVFSILVIISLGFLGFSLINTSRRAVANTVLRDYEDIARRAAQELTGLIDKPKEILVTAAILLPNIPVSETALQKTVLYQVFTDHHTQFEHIALVDVAGREIVTSDWAAPLKNRSAEPLFQSVANSGRTDYSQAYFSPEHVPYFDLAVPVRRLNKPDGCLIARIKLSSFWDMVDGIKLKNGEAFIVDEAGYVLVHKEEHRVYRSENLAFALPVQQALKGFQGSLEDTSLSGDPAGKFLCAYAPIRPFNWGLIVRQPASTAYAFSDRMQKIALATILAAILIAIILSLFLARWIVKPIKQLVSSTGQVAAGNLDGNIETRRTDEVGGLLRTFNDMLQKLRSARQLERLSNIGLATSKIGHELRNPLVAIKAFIQLLPRKYRDEAFISRFNELVPSELARLEKMMQDLSEFSNAPKLRLADCRPEELVNSALGLFGEQLKNTRINTVTSSSLNGVLVTADGDRLKQVLINLINNAIESMPNGGQLSVNTRAGPKQQTALIEIKDTGCGIAPDRLAAVFEPFHTSKCGGLGLGLTISGEIIKQHHGTIEVASQPDKGTSFTITLPAKGANYA